MHAGFQLIFSSFLRALLCSHLLGLPPFHSSFTFSEPGIVQPAPRLIPVFLNSPGDLLRCYRDRRLRDDISVQGTPLAVGEMCGDAVQTAALKLMKGNKIDPEIERKTGELKVKKI